jgi:hypothetical protein
VLTREGYRGSPSAIVRANQSGRKLNATGRWHQSPGFGVRALPHRMAHDCRGHDDTVHCRSLHPRERVTDVGRGSRVSRFDPVNYKLENAGKPTTEPGGS